MWKVSEWFTQNIILFHASVFPQHFLNELLHVLDEFYTMEKRSTSGCYSECWNILWCGYVPITFPADYYSALVQNYPCEFDESQGLGFLASMDIYNKQVFILILCDDGHILPSLWYPSWKFISISCRSSGILQNWYFFGLVKWI